MKVKPIFIIKLPKDLTRDEVNDSSKIAESKITDYHVLVVMADVPEVEFQVFYEKDFNEVRYEELKKIVKDSMINRN